MQWGAKTSEVSVVGNFQNYTLDSPSKLLLFDDILSPLKSIGVLPLSSVEPELQPFSLICLESYWLSIEVGVLDR